MKPIVVLLCVLFACSGGAGGSDSGSKRGVGGAAGVKFEILRRSAAFESPRGVPFSALRENSIPQSLALGAHVGCLLATTGPFAQQVVCWTDAAPAPVAVPLPDLPLQLSAGTAHVCALGSRGYIYCWGSNSNGQLGADPSLTMSSATPVLVAPPGDAFTQLAAGGNTTCALTGDGSAYCWGANGSGQLGNGTLRDAWQPQAVLLNGPVQQIATSANHTCATAFFANPVVQCWGDDEHGQLANVAGAEPAAPGTHAYDKPVEVLRGIGPYENGGYDGLEHIDRLALGDAHTCGMTLYGNYYCWGDDSLGQLGDVTATNMATSWWTGATFFSSADFGDAPGASGIVTVKDGPVPYSSGSFVLMSQMVSGANHVCVLTAGPASDSAGDTVYCWGSNAAGQLGPLLDRPDSLWRPVPAPDLSVVFVEVAAGGDRTCAIGSDGHVYCWGGGSANIGKLPGGPYFDDLRTAAAAPPPAGRALVNCLAHPNAGFDPGPLSSYVFVATDVFGSATNVSEVQFDLWSDATTMLNEFELTAYAIAPDGTDTPIGSSRASNIFFTLGSAMSSTVRFHFRGDGLAVPEARTIAFRLRQRSGQTLSVGANTIANAGSAECPAERSTEIPIRIYAK